MKKVRYNNIFAKLLLWRKGFDTAMLFGFICTKRRKSEYLYGRTVNHEAIHVAQYFETTVVSFTASLLLQIAFGFVWWAFFAAASAYYLLYFVEAAISFVSHIRESSKAAADKAYYNSMFEQEAYAFEGDLTYLDNRKMFAWLKYFGKI